jgi:hypothetical protein
VPCGVYAIASFLCVSYSSPVATPANRFMLLRAQVVAQATSAYSPACAYLGTTSLFDGIIIANTTFVCTALLGWSSSAGGASTTGTAVAVGNTATPASATFLGASTNALATAGTLGTIADAGIVASAVCAWLLLDAASGGATATMSLTLSRSRSVSATRTPSPAVSTSATLRISKSFSPLRQTHGLAPPPLVRTRSRTLQKPEDVHTSAPTSNAPAHTVIVTVDPAAPPSTPLDTSRPQVTSPSRTLLPSPGVLDGIATAAPRARVVPEAVTVGVASASTVATAVAAFVGMPLAFRTAVVGAALRLSTCVADGDGPEIPPYEAMPVQFVTLDTNAATAGIATATNVAFVALCTAIGFVATAGHGLRDAEGEQLMRATFGHVAATVPLFFIGPAFMEFGVAWISAAAVDGDMSVFGIWLACFVGGIVVAVSGVALLLWRARTVETKPVVPQPKKDATSDALQVQTQPSSPALSDAQASERWLVLVGPLIECTRDHITPHVRYAVFVELSVALAFSAFSGVRVNNLCVAKCVAATLIAVGFLVYLVLVHPALERMDHWFGVLFAALQAATGALIASAVVASRSADGAESSYADTALWVAEGVSHVALVMVAVQAIIGLVVACRERSASTEPDGNAQPLLTVPPPPAASGAGNVATINHETKHAAGRHRGRDPVLVSPAEPQRDVRDERVRHNPLQQVARGQRR